MRRLALFLLVPACGSSSGASSDLGDAGPSDAGATLDSGSDLTPDGGSDPPPRVVGIVLGAALLEMPGYGTMPNSVLAPVQLAHAHWMAGGSFVITAAACHQYRETRGLWVFGEDGTAAGEAHTCLDSLAEGEDPDDLSLWAHEWSSSNLLFQPLDGTRFVVGGTTGGSHPYPPKVYALAAGPSLAERPFALRVAPKAVSEPPDFYTQYEAPHFVAYAVVGDRMIATVETASGRSNVLYALPGLTELARTDQTIEPIGMVGDLVVTRRVDASGILSGLDRLGDDGSLTEVHPLPSSVFPQGASLDPPIVADPLDPTHVALRSADGIREIRVTDAGPVEIALHDAAIGTLALYGESAIVAVCDEGALVSRCGLEVRTAGEIGERVVLPDEQVYGSTETQPAGRPHSIAISPSGVGVVVTDYGAYRFELLLE
jgi:hypothetical protein